MDIRRAVITAAGRDQRDLPLQTLVDGSGLRRSVLWMLVDETVQAGVHECALVIRPGSDAAYRAAAGEHGDRLTFIHQPEPGGYAHALWCAREFADGESVLHLVGDHVYLSRSPRACARQLVDVAAAERCTVSAVQATRESRLPDFGAVGGAPIRGRPGLYTVEDVLEKPTPTEAEQRLHVPGLRAGQYLCFFGMHVLAPSIWVHLEAESERRNGSLSAALASLAKTERCLALEPEGLRHDVGSRYGLLWAQLCLALAGPDREEVLEELVELMALRDPRRR